MAETLSIPHLRDSNTCSVIFVKNHCRLTKLAINRNFVVGSVKMPTHFNENTRGKRSGGIIPRNSANSAKDARYREFLVIFSKKSQNSPQSTILRIAAHFLSPLGPSLPYLGHVCPRTHSPLRKTRLGRGGIGNLATHLAPTVISPHERYSAVSLAFPPVIARTRLRTCTPMSTSGVLVWAHLPHHFHLR